MKVIAAISLPEKGAIRQRTQLIADNLPGIEVSINHVYNDNGEKVNIRNSNQKISIGFKSTKIS